MLGPEAAACACAGQGSLPASRATLASVCLILVLFKRHPAEILDVWP